MKPETKNPRENPSPEAESLGGRYRISVGRTESQHQAIVPRELFERTLRALRVAAKGRTPSADAQGVQVFCGELAAELEQLELTVPATLQLQIELVAAVIEKLAEELEELGADAERVEAVREYAQSNRDLAVMLGTPATSHVADAAARIHRERCGAADAHGKCSLQPGHDGGHYYLVHGGVQ